MSTRRWIVAVLGAGALSVGAAACGSDAGGSEGGATETAPGAELPQGSEPANLDPAEFTAEIDNPWWPMAVGSRWVYRETDSDGTVQRVEVTVTDRTKRIANGIEARVVRDEVTERGEPVEITDDWYAQDADGNVWYLGEDTAEYENGEVVSRAGSFEAGVDGAEPGVLMPAHPEDGMSYRQEHYAGEAEDEAEVLSLDEQVEVPFGHFEGALMTRDTNPLEPRVSEHKFYARGVGPVLTLDISGGTGREELLRYTEGGGS
jgi:hypothetical protein